MKALITGKSKLAGAIISRLHDTIVYKKLEIESCRVEAEIPWKHFDVFINNAWHNYIQIDLLNAIFNKWKDNENKTIVNISSLSKYPGLSGNQTGYSATKAALSHQAFLLMFKTDRKCRMININPGFVDTDMISGIPGIENKNKITANECADAIVWAINQPQHIEIGELSIWRPF